jgi:hypothetical protein
MSKRQIFKGKNYFIPFLILFLGLVTTIFHLINFYRMRMGMFHYSELSASNNTLIGRKFDEKIVNINFTNTTI